MKKVFLVIFSSLLMIFITSCGIANENTPEKTVEKFIYSFYECKIEDYKQLDTNDFMQICTNFYEPDSKKIVKELLTENCYNHLLILGTPLIDFCMKNMGDISVKNITIKKYSQNEDDTVTYDYDATLIVTGKYNSTLPTKGQLKLGKIDGHWKIILIGKLDLSGINKFY